MKNILFYTATVLIWGSTWIAIKFQISSIDPMVSVAYRFSLAAVLLMLWCTVRRFNMRFSIKEHFFMGLQGTFLFALNYWLFYVSELYITSGLAAVIFSTVLIFNMINGAIFLKSSFNARIIVGGVLGLCGIIMVFKPELTGFYWKDQAVLGISTAFCATLLASFGNIISARNQKNGLPIVQTNAWGMTYGAVLMLAIAAISGKTFVLDLSWEYIGALAYLAVFGSIVAFGCYLSLLGRIGAERAAYATLLFPIVALIISTIWEGYNWSIEAFAGVGLILSGNLFMMQKTSIEPIKTGLKHLNKIMPMISKSSALPSGAIVRTSHSDGVPCEKKASV